MANEIKVVYITGRTITYGAYQPDGTVRTAAGTALTETAGTGYYKANDAAILAGDTVIVKESTSIIGSAEYQPDTVATNMRGTDNAATEAKQDIMQTSIDNIPTTGGGTPELK